MANERITDLTAATSLSSGDVLAIDNSTPNSRKITASNAAKSFRGFAFSGAMVSLASALTSQNYSSGVAVPFNAEVYDTDSYHDNSTNNTRITIPENGYYVFSYNVNVASTLTASDYIRAILQKNGSSSFEGTAQVITEISGTPSVTLCATSGPISCAAADYFEVWVDTESDTSITIDAPATTFSVHRVG